MTESEPPLASPPIPIEYDFNLCAFKSNKKDLLNLGCDLENHKRTIIIHYYQDTE